MMLPKKTHLFRRVAIIGVGLIGGSLSLAIKKHRLAREVVGVSRRHSSLMYAFRKKIIDRYATDIKRAVHDADLVVLAVPVRTMIDLLPTISRHLKRGAIVTDVGSTKTSIVEAAQCHIPSHAFFVGSHPIAGSEKKGAAWATAELFEQSACVITATDKTNKMAQERIKNLWTAVGATTKFLTPQEHDRILSYVSHVPHLLAFGLMEAIPSECLEYASQGLHDTTRIAASDPHVWSEICLENSTDIVQSLDACIKALSLYRKSIVSKNHQSLVEHFANAKNKRDGIAKK